MTKVLLAVIYAYYFSSPLFATFLKIEATCLFELTVSFKTCYSVCLLCCHFFIYFQILDKVEQNQGRIHVHYIPGSYYSNHDKHELKEIAVFQSKIFVWPSGLS